MPCLSYDTEWAHTHTGRNTRNSAEIMLLKNECDKLARIACKALAVIEQTDPKLDSVGLSRTDKAWWTAHKKADAARIAKEEKENAKKLEQDRLRKEALAKLTPEEIEAIGLNKNKAKKSEPAPAYADKVKWPGL